MRSQSAGAAAPVFSEGRVEQTCLLWFRASKRKTNPYRMNLLSLRPSVCQELLSRERVEAINKNVSAKSPRNVGAGAMLWAGGGGRGRQHVRLIYRRGGAALWFFSRRSATSQWDIGPR
ncbi:hypothetical protein EVAR_36247_1 [Eumeta japonica]|uniref:Uncharacterized protein n=1 Tax=Eumeta variegata TaxID=151549 RepID=A0A4C1WZL3_EUMVA|nr:hypothetical protein EVAR_36247_1 [Eumeta japonica]